MDALTSLSFRAKLLLALLCVVGSATFGSVYFAEQNLQRSQRRARDAQFQNQLRSFLALRETRSASILERCRALAQSVRLRAALEERDVEDLYRNASTELQSVLDPEDEAGDAQSFRVSFFRFLDRDGKVLAPDDQPAGYNYDADLQSALAPAAGLLRTSANENTGFIAVRSGSDLAALREVVVSKILDWDGRTLGAIALGFPIQSRTASPNERQIGIRSGISIDNNLYISGLDFEDRARARQQLVAAISTRSTGQAVVDLTNGPHLLFFQPLNAQSVFPPAFQIYLYPLADSLREAAMLRWKILALGAAVLIAAGGASFYLAGRLAKPVDEIVAGSLENLTRRKQAEKDLRETNRELEQALAQLKATQKQVIQQERLSAIGQMASGIAHDFNNTLMPILGFSDLLLKDDRLLSDKNEARSCLEMLHTAAQDAANVVHRLRQFYRPLEENEEFPIVDLARIVQQSVSLTEPKWRHQAQAGGATINVTTNLKALPIVAGEESALREVLTNLIFNAVDAMPDGGTIMVETAIEEECAVVRVRDTGTGMSEVVRQRCLEPFFSTKGERGTGLGLSMVYGIVERHRGKLDIESTLGQGTTFIVRLPLAEELPQEKIAETPVRSTSSGLEVLIVDDEERIRDVVTTYLRCDGHRVAQAASGREALEKFRRHPFDLVVLDRVMPEMNGEQTARFLKQLNPRVPVIMLTGFGSPTDAPSVDIVLNKPITIDALRHTIDKVLHAA